MNPEGALLAEIDDSFIGFCSQCVDLRLHLIDLSEEHVNVSPIEGCLILDHIMDAGPERRHLLV